MGRLARILRSRCRAGIGVGMFGGSGLVALYGLGALIAAAILGLATAVAGWLAALIVAVVLFAAAGVLALTGKQQVEQATFFQDVHNHKYQLWDDGWEADYPDAEDFLDINFFSQSQLNDVNYKNPQVDDLLTKARTEQDKEKRTQEYQQAEQIIVNDAAWLPLVFDKSEVLIKPYVKGYDLVGMIIPILRYVSIQK